MTKIKLIAEPSFSFPVPIPRPGAEPASVLFTFKHRTKDAVLAWAGEIEDKPDAAVIAEMATAWELDDAFDAENIERLCQNYAGAAKAIFSTYLRELRGAREKN